MAHGLLYNTFGYTGEIRMVTLVQSLTVLFVVVSLLLIILVPITFSTREQREKPNDTIKGIAALWVISLLSLAIANIFIESW